LVLEFAGQTIQEEEGVKWVCGLKDPYTSCCSQLCFPFHQMEDLSTNITRSDSKWSDKTQGRQNLIHK